MRKALTSREFSTVFRNLFEQHGYSQQAIAELTGQTQPEISEVIANSRTISHIHVIERLVFGLGIPPCYVGLRCTDCAHTPIPPG